MPAKYRNIITNGGVMVMNLMVQSKDAPKKQFQVFFGVIQVSNLYSIYTIHWYIILTFDCSVG